MVFSRLLRFIRKHDEEVQYQALRLMFVQVQLMAFIGLLFVLSNLGWITP